jgi:hypothetical protein
MKIVQPKSLLDRGFTVLGLSIFFGKLDQKPEEPKELVRRMRRMLEKPWKFTGFARHITRCFTSDHGGDACHEYNGRKQGARHEKSHGGGCGNHILAKEAASTHNLCLSCFFNAHRINKTPQLGTPTTGVPCLQKEVCRTIQLCREKRGTPFNGDCHFSSTKYKPSILIERIRRQM